MDIDALTFHNLSKHHRDRILTSSSLDWSREPSRVKRYPGAPEVELPASLPLGMSIFDLIIGARPNEPASDLGLEEFGNILRLGYGRNLERGSPGGGVVFRTAPSAGALFPAELYLCCGDADDLAAGIYYFNPLAGRLIRLLEGDFRKEVSSSLGTGWGSQAYIIVTAIPWRTAWKYGMRTYRYCLIDPGHVVGNLLLVAGSLGIESRVVSQVDESRINPLLGIDGESELVVAAIPLKLNGVSLPESPKQAQPAKAADDSVYPKPDDRIIAFHKSESWSKGMRILEPLEVPGPGLSVSTNRMANREVSDLIIRRRSYRGSAVRQLSRGDLASYLRIVSWAYPADWHSLGIEKGWEANLLPEFLFVVFDVEGLNEGIYRFDAARRVLVPTELSLDPHELVHACMGQKFIAKANAFLVIALDFTRLTKRGAYRVALLDAGVVGQLAYLAAEAIGAGCCGIGAFFDDEFSAVLGLDDRDHNALYGLTIAKR